MEPDEKRLDNLEDEVQGIDIRLTTVEGQVGRITSHIESEVGLARGDLARIENKLFGKEDEEYGGKVGHINRRIYRMEVWLLALACASGIVMFALGVYYYISKSFGK